MPERESGVHIHRRDARHSLGSLVAAGFLGCSSSSTTAPTASTPTSTQPSTPPTTNASCIVTPPLTEGPYFVDERLNRSDIRSDPASGVVSPGVLLTLIVKLSQITTAGACAALAGALVDVWHCDAAGVYSDISGQRSAPCTFTSRSVRTRAAPVNVGVRI